MPLEQHSLTIATMTEDRATYTVQDYSREDQDMAPRVFDRNGNKRDWVWLRDEYGYVQYHDAGTGDKFGLVEVRETTGNALLKVQVLNEDGDPHAGQPVANHWPDDSLPYLGDSGSLTLYHARAAHQDTDSNGFTGFGLGTGSYIKDLEVGGPHTVWVLSPTLPSDGISGLGMLGGTNHDGMLFLTFQIVSGDETEPPEPPEPETGQKQRVLEKVEAVADMRVGADPGDLDAAGIYLAIAAAL